MNQPSTIVPGMTLSLDSKIYRVESAVKVAAPKGTPFIKAKLRDLANDDIIEKNFRPDQEIQAVTLAEKTLEFLYMEGKDYMFLDTESLDQVVVSPDVIGGKAHYLKEGIEVKAIFYGNSIFSVELPQFLEIMVMKTENAPGSKAGTNATKLAFLETGAKLQVPLFIESGDIIKVDTLAGEYIQRV